MIFNLYLEDFFYNNLMENEYIIIDYLDDKIKVLKYLSESNSEFQNRLNYIKNCEKKKLNFKEALRLSKIWYSIIFKKCKYSHEISDYVLKYHLERCVF